MRERKIKISRESELSYQLDLFNSYEDNQWTEKSLIYYGEEIEDHFVLMLSSTTYTYTTFEMRGEPRGVSTSESVFGVTHNREEAGKRLYDEAKSMAKAWTGAYGIEKIVGDTKSILPKVMKKKIE